MEETDLERRLAAMEQTQQRLQADLSRLEEAVENARRPTLSFLVRIAVWLIGLGVLVEFIPGFVLAGGTSLYRFGGRGAVWGVVLGCFALLAIGLVVGSTVRNRAARRR
ncbi:hypothetical protein [Streptantibioticus ferralitis]|uniref:Uncharacterized protein n=1 Tax=Streptantibioticus ferralitis TaxID=236510 RepID=A0ABT5YWM7_9ACTN|nr:hypothetical protein [Streptantibioticus ferralitis]MDF2255994.1 hypothetical protein [Streptantibioticus ferralitis]